MRREAQAVVCAWLTGCAADHAGEGSEAAAATDTHATGIALTDAPTGGGEDAPKLDLDGADPGGSPCGAGDLGLSSIWIANSTQGTVSKIITLKAANSGEYGRIQGVA